MIASFDGRLLPNTPITMHCVCPSRISSACTWIALLPVRSTLTCTSTVPAATGAIKVVCKVRSGTPFGIKRRMACTASADCKPPNALRPCSQSSPITALKPAGVALMPSSISEKRIYHLQKNLTFGRTEFLEFCQFADGYGLNSPSAELKM